MFCVVAPLLQTKVYGAVPLDAERLTLPLLSPHVALVGVSVAVGTAVVVKVAPIVAVQLFASVTVTLNVPADMFVKSCVVAPLLQAYVKFGVPPFTVISTKPFASPQVAFVGAMESVCVGKSI